MKRRGFIASVTAFCASPLAFLKRPSGVSGTLTMANGTTVTAFKSKSEVRLSHPVLAYCKEHGSVELSRDGMQKVVEWNKQREVP
jgi:hypothetical protein